MVDADDDKRQKRNRRLLQLKVHFGIYAVVMVQLALANMLITPQNPWFVVPLVAWLAPLAIHVAWVMGIFGGGE